MGAVDEPTEMLPEANEARFAVGRAAPGDPHPTAALPTTELRAAGSEQATPVGPGAAGPSIAPRRRGGFPRGVLWVVSVLLTAAVLVAGVGMSGLVPGLENPFAEQTTDRSQPPLLLSIRDLNRFVAAEANFEVVIDLKRDRKFIPDWLLNQRTLFIAAGSVEGYVDFGALTQQQIIESEDRRSVEIRLPAPKLGEPKLDLERSYVFTEERGLINRLGDFFEGDPNKQQSTLLEAEKKIAEAAKASTLLERSRENTTKTLEGMLHGLGYTTVKITYAAV